MDELSNLYSQCRAVLLTCDEFQNDDSLRALFTASQLNSYSHKIPEANTRDQRVDRCLGFLRGRRFKGQPLLALFLEILGSRYPEDDDTHRALLTLAKEVHTPSSEARARQTTVSSRIDMGIVVTLKEEFIELLGEFISTYTSEYDDDLRTYYYHFQIGTANKTNTYRCVATFIGDMGLTKAALATEKLVSKWKPDTTVLLGIAAALDSDVLLGDIVVANQIDMYLENAKAVPGVGGEGYTFQLSGEVYPSSHDLRVRAEHFEIAHRTSFRSWQEQCARDLQLLSPQPEIANMISNRQLRQQPQLHIGHLASGPAVGGSLAFKNWLKSERDRKYLALEMESGGFMTALHERGHLRSLVLRGISDYGDERKKELDEASKGAFRRYAVHNAMRLLWSLSKADIFRH